MGGVIDWLIDMHFDELLYLYIVCNLPVINLNYIFMNKIRKKNNFNDQSIEP